MIATGITTLCALGMLAWGILGDNSTLWLWGLVVLGVALYVGGSASSSR